MTPNLIAKLQFPRHHSDPLPSQTVSSDTPILLGNVVQELQNIQYLAFAPRMSEPVDQSYKPVLTSGSQALFALVNLKETIGPCACKPPWIEASGAVSLMHGRLPLSAFSHLSPPDPPSVRVLPNYCCSQDLRG